jgi:hypothetical protein
MTQMKSKHLNLVIDSFKPQQPSIPKKSFTGSIGKSLFCPPTRSANSKKLLPSTTAKRSSTVISDGLHVTNNSRFLFFAVFMSLSVLLFFYLNSRFKWKQKSPRVASLCAEGQVRRTKQTNTHAMPTKIIICDTETMTERFAIIKQRLCVE